MLIHKQLTFHSIFAPLDKLPLDNGIKTDAVYSSLVRYIVGQCQHGAGQPSLFFNGSHSGPDICQLSISPASSPDNPRHVRFTGAAWYIAVLWSTLKSNTCFFCNFYILKLTYITVLMVAQCHDCTALSTQSCKLLTWFTNPKQFEFHTYIIQVEQTRKKGNVEMKIQQWGGNLLCP